MSKSKGYLDEIQAHSDEDIFKEMLRVHKLPPAHRRRVYTTNIMERLMKEIKLRTRVVGIFPNQA